MNKDLKDSDDNKNARSAYAKYSSLAFQMLGTILVLTFLGRKMDEWLAYPIPIATLVLSLFSIGASLYLFIKGATKP